MPDLYPPETDGGIIKKMRQQNAVYWPPNGVDRQGRPSLGEPTVIRCRWEDTIQAYLDGFGEERNSNAKVYVDRPVELGGRLWLSPLIGRQTIAAVLGSGVPAEPLASGDVYEIKRFDTLPTLKAKYTLKTAMV